jgi:5-methylcytosine-specific restriction endonuclease McrA
MIPLTRATLSKRLENWLAKKQQQLNDEIDATGAASPGTLANYREKRLKTVLMSETNEKCAYCESKLTHVYFGDVEHIIPRSREPRLALSHNNLTIACAVCNNTKGDAWDPICPHLNPYADDPDDHVAAAGAFLARRPGAHRGLVTISTFELNRPALVEKRWELWTTLQALADAYHAAPMGPPKDAYASMLLDYTKPSAEYSYFAKAYLASIGLELEA